MPLTGETFSKILDSWLTPLVARLACTEMDGATAAEAVTTFFKKEWIRQRDERKQKVREEIRRLEEELVLLGVEHSNLACETGRLWLHQEV